MDNKTRDDTYIVLKSSVPLPGPGTYPSKSEFAVKNKTIRFSQLARFPVEKSGSGALGPGSYAINGTIGVVAGYHKIQTTA